MNAHDLQSDWEGHLASTHSSCQNSNSQLQQEFTQLLRKYLEWEGCLKRKPIQTFLLPISFLED